MLKPLSLRRVDHLPSINRWRVRQTFEKDGKPRTVTAWGSTRERAIKAFYVQLIMLKDEPIVTRRELFQYFADLAQMIRLGIKALKDKCER